MDDSDSYWAVMLIPGGYSAGSFLMKREEILTGMYGFHMLTCAQDVD